MNTITADFVKEVATHVENGHQPAQPIQNIQPEPAVAADEKPAEVTPAAPAVEAVITPPSDTPPQLSKEQEDYLTSLNAPNEKAEKEIKENENANANNESNARAKENEVSFDDPFINDLIEVRKKGGDVKAFVKETLSDVDDLSDEQVMERSLKELGFSEQEIADEMERTFSTESTLSKLQKKQLVNPMREKMKSAQSEKAKKYLASIPDNSATIKQEQERVQNIVTQATTQLEAMKDNFVGKSFLGLPQTEEMWNDVHDYIKKEGHTFPIVKDGKLTGFDLNEAVEYAVFKKYRNQIALANIALGEVKGYNKFYSQRNRPSQENTSTATVISEQEVSKTLDNNFGVNKQKK